MADDGFTIPLEGDAEPFRDAVSGLRRQLSKATRQLSSGTRGSVKDVGRLGMAWRTMGRAGRLATGLALRGLRGIRASAALAGRAVRGVFARLRGFGGGLGKLLGGALPFAGLLGAGGAIGSIIGAVRGLKGAFDVGSELSDLSARTGLAVAELQVLQQAFEDSGVSGEKVAATVNKMQRSLSDARAGLSTQTRAFDRLGLSVENLLAMSPSEQFDAIQTAIAALPSATDRAASAMEIFGRSGSELLTLFRDGGAIGRARETIGAQAEILQRNAARFDRVSDLLKSAGKKIQGFFVGVAEKVAPVILQALEAFNKVDFSAIGSRIGRTLLTVVAAFREGRIMELLSAGFRVAVTGAVDILMRGLRGATAFLSTALPPIFDVALAKLRDPLFWEGILNLFRGVGQTLKAEILSALPGRGDEAEFARYNADTFLETSRVQFALAAGGRDAGAEIAAALGAAAQAAARAMSGSAGRATREARETFMRLWQTFSGHVDRLQGTLEEAQEPGPGGTPPLLGPEAGAAGASAGQPSLTRIVSSLARIGGGGVGFTVEPMLNEARTQTTLLRKIENHTAKLATSGGSAVYA